MRCTARAKVPQVLKANLVLEVLLPQVPVAPLPQVVPSLTMLSMQTSVTARMARTANERKCEFSVSDEQGHLVDDRQRNSR
mmetsp:Transcript_28988/g.35234  ORF Transcript_28988/g.35234 Transcript_28988/m.35234 type:complete len:81 (-) Transcript_28988:236-478(-)